MAFLQIEIHAKRNEILDQSSLIMRYQAEIAALRRQLEEAAQGKGVAMVVDPLHPEVISHFPLTACLSCIPIADLEVHEATPAIETAIIM